MAIFSSIDFLNKYEDIEKTQQASRLDQNRYEKQGEKGGNAKGRTRGSLEVLVFCVKDEFAKGEEEKGRTFGKEKVRI